jgi:hypothetical protein
MEQTLVHLAHAALWFFVVVFVLAVIGVIAIIQWIMNAIRRTETAVESGVQNVEERFKR